MHKYFHRIHVVGRGRFPIDQLRRYEMFPLSVEAATAIERSFERDSVAEKFDVDLGMYSSSLAADGACIDRFASFGWSAHCTEIWKEEDGDNVLYWTNAGGYERERKYADAYGDV